MWGRDVSGAEDSGEGSPVRYVLDASVAVASLRSNETGHAAAVAFLSPLLKGQDSLVVPAIFLDRNCLRSDTRGLHGRPGRAFHRSVRGTRNGRHPRSAQCFANPPGSLRDSLARHRRHLCVACRPRGHPPRNRGRRDEATCGHRVRGDFALNLASGDRRAPNILHANGPTFPRACGVLRVPERQPRAASRSHLALRRTRGGGIRRATGCGPALLRRVK